MNVDLLVNDWLIGKWLSGDGEAEVRYNYDEHGPISAVRVISADAGWECGCYSSWTRDDDFRMNAVFQTQSGKQITFEYGRWGDFPSFIEELDAYRYNRECRIENRSNRYGW